jgi:hypothetical protein
MSTRPERDPNKPHEYRAHVLVKKLQPNEAGPKYKIISDDEDIPKGYKKQAQWEEGKPVLSPQDREKGRHSHDKDAKVEDGFPPYTPKP